MKLISLATKMIVPMGGSTGTDGRPDIIGAGIHSHTSANHRSDDQQMAYLRIRGAGIKYGANDKKDLISKANELFSASPGGVHYLRSFFEFHFFLILVVK
ncbi:MAG: hypothetical protein JAZ12_17105 [Candidatus Thiodiazotropha taylori]|nr:hypothetical protein [Candidatus Thiodiazotropha taylori]